MTDSMAGAKQAGRTIQLPIRPGTPQPKSTKKRA